MLLNCSEVSNVNTCPTGRPKSVVVAAPNPGGPNSIFIFKGGVPAVVKILDIAKMALEPKTISALEAPAARPATFVTDSTPPDPDAGEKTAANVATKNLL
jgi:hypothetical protein